MSGRPEALDRGSAARYRDGLPFLGRFLSLALSLCLCPVPQGPRE